MDALHPVFWGLGCIRLPQEGPYRGCCVVRWRWEAGNGEQRGAEWGWMGDLAPPGLAGSDPALPAWALMGLVPTQVLLLGVNNLVFAPHCSGSRDEGAGPLRLPLPEQPKGHLQSRFPPQEGDAVSDTRLLLQGGWKS